MTRDQYLAKHQAILSRLDKHTPKPGVPMVMKKSTRSLVDVALSVPYAAALFGSMWVLEPYLKAHGIQVSPSSWIMGCVLALQLRTVPHMAVKLMQLENKGPLKYLPVGKEGKVSALVARAQAQVERLLTPRGTHFIPGNTRNETALLYERMRHYPSVMQKCVEWARTMPGFALSTQEMWVVKEVVDRLDALESRAERAQVPHRLRKNERDVAPVFAHVPTGVFKEEIEKEFAHMDAQWKGDPQTQEAIRFLANMVNRDGMMDIAALEGRARRLDEATAPVVSAPIPSRRL